MDDVYPDRGDEFLCPPACCQLGAEAAEKASAVVAELCWKNLAQSPHQFVEPVVLNEDDARDVRAKSLLQFGPGSRMHDHPTVAPPFSQANEDMQRQRRFATEAQGRMFGHDQDAQVSWHFGP